MRSQERETHCLCIDYIEVFLLSRISIKANAVIVLVQKRVTYVCKPEMKFLTLSPSCPGGPTGPIGPG